MSKLFYLIAICFTAIHLNSCTNSMLEKPALAQAADYNMQLGLAYLQAGNHPRAKEKLLLAVHEAPKSPAVLDAMAYFLEVTGEPINAEKYYKDAIRFAPHAGMALNNYGTFLCRMKHYVEAERYLLAAAHEPSYLHTAEAYENAGLCAMHIPDEIAAESYFDHAIKQDPHRQTAHYMLALIKKRKITYKAI